MLYVLLEDGEEGFEGAAVEGQIINLGSAVDLFIVIFRFVYADLCELTRLHPIFLFLFNFANKLIAILISNFLVLLNFNYFLSDTTVTRTNSFAVLLTTLHKL